MYTLITVLIIIVCVLLVLIVLVQNSKGGGLASNFQSSTQLMGVRKTNDFLEKFTWTLAALLLVLCIMGSAFLPREGANQQQSAMKNQIENSVDPNSVPNFPTTAPAAKEKSAETATPAGSEK